MEVLAVDGGQSAVRLRHTSGRTDVAVNGISRLEGDPIVGITAAVSTGWRELGSPTTERAVLGLTTAPADVDLQERLCDAVAQGTGAHEIWLADDAVTGHAGALALGWGISVIAGTGVACGAMAPAGPLRIIGGHGYLIGDEGGAFWIGRAGVGAALRASDGRGPGTTLQRAAARYFDGLADLGDRLHSSSRPVDTIARFAPDVIDAAERGDDVATTIVEAAVEELAALVRAGVHGLDDVGASVPLALGGRLLETGPYRDRVERAIAVVSPACTVGRAAGTPLDGAMRLGRATDPGSYLEHVFVWEARR